MNKKSDWTEQEIKRYIFAKIGCRPTQSSVVKCPICGSIVFANISAVTGQLKAFCSTVNCFNIKE